jgi:hypothetical protein
MAFQLKEADSCQRSAISEEKHQVVYKLLPPITGFARRPWCALKADG